MSRKTDIFEMLDYADQRFGELFDKIFEGGMSATEVKFLGTTAGDVLSSSREVFDYCAKDIIEAYVSPNDADLAAKMTSGALRCYYPFYKNQLLKKDRPFSKLKNFNKPLHSHLFSIAAAIEANKQRPKTMLSYGLLRDMADMVNQKKHNKLLAVKPSGGETIYAQMPGGKLMVPKEQQIGISGIQLPPNTKHTVGDTYVFEFKKKNLLDFTSQCKNLTRLIMDDIYGNFFP